VRRNLIFADKEAAFLKELNKRKVKFMIVGLSAAALQGAPVVTQDVDLWFRDLEDPNIRKALARVDGIFVPSIGMNPPMLAGEAVKLFDVVVNMHGVGSFDEEYKGAEKVNLCGTRISVLPLASIIRSKAAVGREKDRIVMKVLKDALKLKQAISPASRNRKR
jgi:predicted nucleotidyltransferase